MEPQVPARNPATGQVHHLLSKGFRGYSRRCRLLYSGESLSALWIRATLTAGRSANESLESLGALRDLSLGGQSCIAVMLEAVGTAAWLHRLHLRAGARRLGG